MNNQFEINKLTYAIRDELGLKSDDIRSYLEIFPQEILGILSQVKILGVESSKNSIKFMIKYIMAGVIDIIEKKRS